MSCVVTALTLRGLLETHHTTHDISSYICDSPLKIDVFIAVKYKEEEEQEN